MATAITSRAHSQFQHGHLVFLQDGLKAIHQGTLNVDQQRIGMQTGIGMDADPERRGRFTVRNLGVIAHSWVEVYFEDYGWLPFDATAGFSYPYALPDNTVSPIPAEMNTPVAEHTTETAETGFHISYVAFLYNSWNSNSMFHCLAVFSDQSRLAPISNRNGYDQ